LRTGEQIAEEDRITLLTAILAEALNLGFTKMAEAAVGVSEARLYWVRDWYLREETYQQALALLVDYHGYPPLSPTSQQNQFNPDPDTRRTASG